MSYSNIMCNPPPPINGALGIANNTKSNGYDYEQFKRKLQACASQGGCDEKTLKDLADRVSPNLSLDPVIRDTIRAVVNRI